MKRHEFLDRLWACLKEVPPTEKVKLIEYYNELYYDRMDGGEAEESIVAGFGTPEAAAEKYLSEAGSGDGGKDTDNRLIDGLRAIYGNKDGDSGEAKSRPAEGEGFGCAGQGEAVGRGHYSVQTAYYATDKTAGQTDKTAGQTADTPAARPFYKNKTFWTVYFAAFLITFPLTVAAFGICIGLIAVVFALAIGFVVGGIAVCAAMGACVIAGVYGVVSSFMIMGQSVPVGLAQMGLSFVAIAVGLAGIYLSIKLVKLAARLFKAHWRRGKKRHGN